MGSIDCKISSASCFLSNPELALNLVEHTQAQPPCLRGIENQLPQSSQHQTKASHAGRLKGSWKPPQSEIEDRKKKAESDMKLFIEELLQKSKQSNQLMQQKRKQNLICKDGSEVQSHSNKRGNINFSRFLEKQKEFLSKKQEFIKRERQLKQLAQLSQSKPLQPSNHSSSRSSAQSRRPSFTRGNFKDRGFKDRIDRIIQQRASATKKDKQQHPGSAQNNNIEELIEDLEKSEDQQEQCCKQKQLYGFHPPFPGEAGLPEPTTGAEVKEKPILEVEIEIDSKFEKIIVTQDDDVDELAIRFLEAHQLPLELRRKLVDAISQSLKSQ